MRESIKSAIYALAIGALVVVAANQCAKAHDAWANGEPVPAWVKKACCGPEDAHHLKPEQVQFTSDGWKVEGYHALIPNGTELPSPDGSYWIFYRTFSDGTQSTVYCFFVPIPSM